MKLTLEITTDTTDKRLGRAELSRMLLETAERINLVRSWGGPIRDQKGVQVGSFEVLRDVEKN
jgi:hypothetical protein